MKKSFSVFLTFGLFIGALFIGSSSALAASTLTSISATTQSSSLIAGTAASTTYSVTVNRSGAGNIDNVLSVLSGLPTGATVLFSPGTVSFTGNSPTSGSSVMTITTTGATPAGTSVITVKAVGNGVTKTATTTLVVGAAPTTATLTVTTTVVNNNGGTKAVSDFPLFISGSSISSGVATTTNLLGSRTVSATGQTGYTVTIGGNCATNGAFTLSVGGTYACTVTATDDAASLTISKVATGGTATFDFSTSGSGLSNFQIDTTQGPSRVFSNLNVGSYSVTEQALTGWDWNSVSCSDSSIATSSASLLFNLVLGQNLTCTYYNTKRGTITVHKDVVSPNGGEASDNQTFTIHKNGDGEGDSISEDNAVTYTNLIPGTYTITEDADSNYEFVSFSQDGDATTTGAQITVVAGTNTDLTITNKQKQGSLRVIKQVTNHNIGQAVASDFIMHVTGTSVSNDAFPGDTEGTTVTLDPGSYTVTETGGPEGYAMSETLTCAGTMTSNGEVTCTITNSDIPTGQGAVTVIKSVTNDNNGELTAGDFSLSISENVEEGATSTSQTVTSGQAQFLTPGSYTVSESGSQGQEYSQTGISCTNGETITTDGSVTLGTQDAWICTITNDDIAPSLTLSKSVTNNNGGTASSEDWTLTATGPTTISGAGNVTSTSTFKAGTYILSEAPTSEETEASEGYTAGSWSCTNEVTVEDNQITLGLGQSTTCTITNDDQPSTLTIVKKTIDESGDGFFNFGITGTSSTEYSNSISLNTEGGEATSEGITLNAGTYDIVEAGTEGWTLADVACEYDNESVGNPLVGLGGEEITVGVGDHVTCTFTNTKHPVIVVPPSAGGGAGLGNIPGGPSDTTTGGGQVLGESTSTVPVTGSSTTPIIVLSGNPALTCDANDTNLIRNYIKTGAKNNVQDVKNLQNFLNQHEGEKLPVTGFYGPLTRAAVIRFQIKEAGVILNPWVTIGLLPNSSNGTGYVYKTTLYTINSFICSTLNLPAPLLP